MNTAASSDERLNLSIIADYIIPERRGIATTRFNAEGITWQTRSLCSELIQMSEEQWIPDLDIALQLATINPSAKERRDIMAPFMKNLQKEQCMYIFVIYHVIDQEERSTLETRAMEVNMMIAIHKATGRIPQERNDFLGRSAEHKTREAAWRATAHTADKTARVMKLYDRLYNTEKQSEYALKRI